jgi:peptidyl-prolyl cis-trans isomerase B (cyclophilin B)
VAEPPAPLAIFRTEVGEFVARLLPEITPRHVAHFSRLCALGVYDRTLFHRVIPGFVLQGGDPLTSDPAQEAHWGTGGFLDERGSPVTVPAEFSDRPHRRGTLSMARNTDPDSASTQFFVVLEDYPSLDGRYTVFGELTAGLEVVDRLVSTSDPDPTEDPRLQGRPRNPQRLLSVRVANEEP